MEESPGDANGRGTIATATDPNKINNYNTPLNTIDDKWTLDGFRRRGEIAGYGATS
jgi:hypothetical protein